MKALQASVRHRAMTIAALALCLVATAASAGPLMDRLREQRQAQAGAASTHSAEVMRDVAYGPDKLQAFDVYLPQAEYRNGAPVILMFHGGGWKRGDKTMRRSLDNKVERWVSRGFIFVSANYRLLPETEVDQQLRDVAQALVTAQDKAAGWGGDRKRFILMGHSAGAHLVALYSAAPRRVAEANASPVLGTIALDSAAMDVARIMEQQHLDLYDRPFGTDPAYWKSMSPYHRLETGSPPILSVCSSRRSDSCDQARRFVDRSRALGNRAEVLTQDISHGGINSELGLDNAYTRAVKEFMAQLDPEVARRLR